MPRGYAFFENVATADPAEKATRLADGISGAMTFTMIGWAVSAAGMLAGLFFAIELIRGAKAKPD